MRARTYGENLKGGDEGVLEVATERMFGEVGGRDVLLVEDILDQGFTLSRVRDLLLSEAGVRSVKLCVLLNKLLTSPSPESARARARLSPDYTGFDVPDRWVAGYGLDAGEEFRELPYVVIVREECFRGNEKDTGGHRNC